MDQTTFPMRNLETRGWWKDRWYREADIEER